jgi:predicted ArsR family transcriptional regulator
VAGSARFTRIPKIQYLIEQGIPTEVIPTYCALSDYANNKSGECFPKMETLAYTLNRSVRTVQRHLHLLREKGLIEFVERRRHKGRYSSYLYRIIHICRTTGHGKRMDKRFLYKDRTKVLSNSPKEAYNWFFGKERNLKAEEQLRRQKEETRKQEAQRRKEGYEWLFT